MRVVAYIYQAGNHQPGKQHAVWENFSSDGFTSELGQHLKKLPL